MYNIVFIKINIYVYLYYTSLVTNLFLFYIFSIFLIITLILKAMISIIMIELSTSISIIGFFIIIMLRWWVPEKFIRIFIPIWQLFIQISIKSISNDSCCISLAIYVTINWRFLSLFTNWLFMKRILKFFKTCHILHWRGSYLKASIDWTQLIQILSTFKVLIKIIVFVIRGFLYCIVTFWFLGGVFKFIFLFCY